jgi:hypothetical protein
MPPWPGNVPRTTLAQAFRNEGKGNVDRKASFKRGRRRTRQDQISVGLQGCESIGSSRAVKPTEIADPWDPHRTKKVHFFCRTGFRKDRSVRTYDPAVDLMSRRHPLSSTRTALSRFAPAKQTIGKARVTCRHERRQFSSARLTSSSWRPCGSSSQSSSLHSSLSF